MFTLLEKERLRSSVRLLLPSVSLIMQMSSPQTVHLQQPAIFERVTFKAKDLRRLLHNLQPDKASSPDNIRVRVLKECSTELARSFSLLFQLCFNQGVFPSQWKTASTITIHRRDSKWNPPLYRPTSLLCIMSKVMEAAT